MSVTPIQDFISSVLTQQTALPSVRTPAAAPAGNAAPAATNDNAVLSSPSGTQLGGASLYNASVSIAQLSSFLEVAQSGTEGISSILQNLQSLAEQAANSVPNASLTTLDSEFQQVLSGINQTVANTTFGGTALLDGALASPQAGNPDTASLSNFSLPDLTQAGLFGDNTLSLLTPSSASSALGLVNNALSEADGVTNAIAQVQSQTNLAGANVETAAANNAASASVLTESDLAGNIANVLDGIIGSPDASSQAQTGNLPGTLMSLLQE